MRTFTVWNQRLPLRAGDEYLANLVLAGEVEAETTSQALEVAKKKGFRAPVVQEKG